jgi:hypothetical protein
MAWMVEFSIVDHLLGKENFGFVDLVPTIYRYLYFALIFISCFSFGPS